MRPFFYATPLSYPTGHAHCRFDETKFSMDQLHYNDEWLLQVILNKHLEFDQKTIWAFYAFFKRILWRN